MQRSGWAGAAAGSAAVLALALGASVLGWGGATNAPLAGASAPPPSAPTGGGEPTALATSPSSAAPTTPPQEPGVLTLAFAGDVHFEEQLAPLLAAPGTALAPVAQALAAADLTVVNLETAITDRGTPEPKKYHFRTSPAALHALAAAGVDVVSMANNHAVDYGADGLEDTLAAVATSPLPVVGVGADAAGAFAPVVRDVRGTSVAVLAATQVPDRTADAWAASPSRAGVAVARDPRQLVSAVRDAAAASELVVVYLHYGTERVGCPTDEQRSLVSELVAAGADVVVGSHAHVLLGAGWDGGAYVSYGLGNFVWYGRNSVAEATTGVLTLTVRDGRVVGDDWLPATVGADGLPHPDAPVDRAAAIATWRSLAACADLATSPQA